MSEQTLKNLLLRKENHQPNQLITKQIATTSKRSNKAVQQRREWIFGTFLPELVRTQLNVHDIRAGVLLLEGQNPIVPKTVLNLNVVNNLLDNPQPSVPLQHLPAAPEPEAREPAEMPLTLQAVRPLHLPAKLHLTFTPHQA
jgi:hypothetical protein